MPIWRIFCSPKSWKTTKQTTIVDFGYCECVDNTRPTSQFSNYIPQWISMPDAYIRNTIALYALGFPGSGPLYWDKDQNSVELGPSKVSSIDDKFYLFHPWWSSMKEYKRIQSRACTSLLRKEQNFDMPTFKLSVDFAWLTFLEHCNHFYKAPCFKF